MADRSANAKADTRGVREGDLLWTPSAERIADANVTKFMNWLARERGLRFRGYAELWQWSVQELDEFWRAMWDYFGIQSSLPYSHVLGNRTMPGAEWFPGARLNYAQHILRNERAGVDALLFMNETTPLAGVGWESFGKSVRTLAARLRELGVRPGERVVAYMPNIPETMIAMLATAAVGAIWACCSPDFGSHGVMDRMQQLTPKVLICVDGYRYAGKAFDRRADLAEIISALASLEQVIYLPYLDEDKKPLREGALLWNDLMKSGSADRGDSVLKSAARENFAFEQVPFDHPLWVLFSSGTTGLPKAVVQSHGGILIEQLKLQHFHMDFRAGDRAFFYTTSGWMMWNFLASMPLSGVCPILYDGNPAYPEPSVLWKVAQDAGASFFGASPAYVEMMSKAGIVPRERYDLSHLRAVMPAGSPVSKIATNCGGCC